MTDFHDNDTTHRPLLPIAIAAAAAMTAAQLASSVWNENRGDLDAAGWGDAPILVVFALAALAVVYGAVTPRIQRSRGAFILGIAALVLVAVAFWNPAPVVFGVAAIGVGRAHKNTPAVALGALAVLAPIALLVAGTIADLGEGGDLKAWCRANQVLSDVDPTEANPAVLEQNVAKLRTATLALKADAPDGIAEGSRVIARRFPQYLDRLEVAGYDASKVDADAFFSDPEVASAGAKLDEFADEHCAERQGDN